MTMYESFRLVNYRGFKKFSIGELARVNLIGGKNNVGKTALLEAIWMHHGFHNAGLGGQVSAFRGIERIRSSELNWDLFSDFDPTQPIKITSKDVQGKSRELVIRSEELSEQMVEFGSQQSKRRPKPSSSSNLLEETRLGATQIVFDYTSETGKKYRGRAYAADEALKIERPQGARQTEAVFLTSRRRESLEELADRFSHLSITKSEFDLVRILQAIEPRLKQLSIQFRSGLPIIFGDIGAKRLMPLPLLGDGMGRLLSIVLAIGYTKNGLVLIDEVDNGLHYSTLQDVWNAIAEVARVYNVQVFSTTHSLECVRAAHLSIGKSGHGDFRYHRLEILDDKPRAVTYDGPALSAALDEGLEMR